MWLRMVVSLVLCAFVITGCRGPSASVTPRGSGKTNAFSAERPAAEPLQELKAAAAAGDAVAQARLGRAYHDGEGLPRDGEQAYLWSRRSAEQGDVTGQLQMGYCCAEGVGTPKNFAEAAEWFRKAAEQGHPVAQLQLGRLYSEGNGVPKDLSQAAEWYRKAAE